MLDVHAPHEPMHGWRDFLLHLVTITIGLLIALSLEGLVEWQHHRHLAHDAETSLHAEVANNASNINTVLTELHKRQDALKHDASVLNAVIATGKYPADKKMSVAFSIVTFDSVSWKTAQSTGALAYIPYNLARDYAGIYAQQDLTTTSEQVSSRDAAIAIAQFFNEAEDGPPPSREEASMAVQKIEILQAQYLIVDAMLQGLATEYSQFLSAHPR